MVGGGDPFYMKFLVNRPRWSEIAYFQRGFSAIAEHLVSLYVRIDVSIYSAAQLQECLINLLTYLLTYYY